MYQEKRLNVFHFILIGAIILVGIISIIFISCFVGGYYNVWSQRKAGEAELARAESNRQIKTLEAKAVEDSAAHLAQAEIVRAMGVAKANEIIGESLKQGDNYLKYLWITSLEHKSKEIIYVPTEANLPILEATRK